MTTEEKYEALTALLRALPDVLSPMQIARTLHQSKNLIYDLAKLDLIDYMMEHTDDDRSHHFKA